MSISLLKTETVTVKRQTNFGQFDDDGFPSNPVFEELTSEGNAQPLSGLEILQVPEADRTRQVLNWFTPDELKLEDIVTRKGIEFEVQTVENWECSGVCIKFFKCRMVKVDVKR